MPSQAHVNFAASLADAQLLLDLYDVEIAEVKIQIGAKSEVLKRACLVMAVAAWETFIKDLLREKFPPRLAAAKSPEIFGEVFNKMAKMWLVSNARNASALAQWTGNGWRKLMAEHVDTLIASMNTPGAAKIQKFFKEFLGVEMSVHWKFPGYGYEAARKRLDEIIKLRGTFAHVARRAGSGPVKHEVHRASLKKYLAFLKQLAEATDRAV